ncbi:D-amino acid dehydrogenase [Polaromonas sp.]|uniref:D-amino acid dehydrogenase n=1 Tax=Polaromonas sp. TaxID=1869339 RepID=UPI0032641959
MHACILGAGITGLATAWQLHREGFEVTVIDRASAGAGASAANGAQLSYAYVQPLADPSIWRQLPQLLLASDSPLTLRPQFDPQQWAWGLRFLAACRGSVSRQTTAQLLALAAQSRAGFEQLLAEEQLDCDFSATGKLVLYPDTASFAAARRQMALQRALGSAQAAVTAQECVAIEPALAHHQALIAGAIHTPGECAADCYKVCQELLRLLRARGVRFLFNTEITRIVLRGGRAIAALTPAGPLEADAFVVALGSASRSLGRTLGLHLRVYPLKGYSITVPINTKTGAAPHVNVTDAARKLVFARVGQRLRVAGIVELVGDNTQIPTTRIASLTRGARELFPEGGDFSACEPWAGLRPATPTGRPIIGRLPGAPANLLFNTGHGALGFTLAFGSAQQIAALLHASPRSTQSVAEPASYSV